VVLGDGAPWIWNLADQHFPGAIQIVDLYHARQHLWKTAALLHPQDPLAKKLWMIPMKDRLDDGNIEPLVTHLREIAAAHADAADLAQGLLKEAEYFATNADRMHYPEFREKGLFVGSGVVEAGCKSVIGSRLKRSGMFWTVRGANSIALRCCRINGRFEDYWDGIGLPDQSMPLTFASCTHVELERYWYRFEQINTDRKHTALPVWGILAGVIIAILAYFLAAPPDRGQKQST
jgi:hypothetical protein